MPCDVVHLGSPIRLSRHRLDNQSNLRQLSELRANSSERPGAPASMRMPAMNQLLSIGPRQAGRCDWVPATCAAGLCDFKKLLKDGIGPNGIAFGGILRFGC